MRVRRHSAIINGLVRGATRTVNQTDRIAGEMLSIQGAIGVAIVDAAAGMSIIERRIRADVDLTLAVTLSSRLVKAEWQLMQAETRLGPFRDILISFTDESHIILPIYDHQELTHFLYLVLDNRSTTLALARYRLAGIAETIPLSGGLEIRKQDEMTIVYDDEGCSQDLSPLNEYADLQPDVPAFLQEETARRLLGIAG